MRCSFALVIQLRVGGTPNFSGKLEFQERPQGEKVSHLEMHG